MKLTGAQILIECLLEQNVDTVFGYPGGTILNVYDALYDHREIPIFSPPTSRAAAHAADGYARSTGKVGVCFATSGPGRHEPHHRHCHGIHGFLPGSFYLLQCAAEPHWKGRLSGGGHHRHHHAHHQMQFPGKRCRAVADVIREAFAIARPADRGRCWWTSPRTPLPPWLTTSLCPYPSTPAMPAGQHAATGGPGLEKP